MAKASKYEYVKAFEQSPTLLRNTFIVIRLDGRAFHKSVRILRDREESLMHLGSPPSMRSKSRTIAEPSIS